MELDKAALHISDEPTAPRASKGCGATIEVVAALQSAIQTRLPHLTRQVRPRGLRRRAR